MVELLDVPFSEGGLIGPKGPEAIFVDGGRGGSFSLPFFLLNFYYFLIIIISSCL
jgi:hypothetical protein